MPYGETFIEQKVAEFATPYQFNGKELDEVTGLYDYGARFYDPEMSVWLSVDPLADDPDNIGWSPYAYVWNNPLKFIDPDGRKGETTIVEDNGDGTYNVKDVIPDGKKDVITTKGKKIGESLTTHSFVDANNLPVIDAVIDMNSTEGQDFIDNEIIEDDPAVVSYMYNAYTVGRQLDFKSRNEDKRGANTSVQQHRYRGSVTKDKKIASARDFGNMAAGIVSGRAGYSYKNTRRAFDMLQGGAEPPVSQKAQDIGWVYGRFLYGNRLDYISKRSITK